MNTDRSFVRRMVACCVVVPVTVIALAGTAHASAQGIPGEPDFVRPGRQVAEQPVVPPPPAPTAAPTPAAATGGGGNDPGVTATQGFTVFGGDSAGSSQRGSDTFFPAIEMRRGNDGYTCYYIEEGQYLCFRTHQYV